MTKYLIIAPIPNYTSEGRANAITENLLYISLPPTVSSDLDKELSVRLFPVLVNPVTQEACLVVDENEPIYVHPAKNLTVLIGLLPELSGQEIGNLAGKLVNGQAIVFADLIPSTATLRTAEEMILLDANWPIYNTV